MRRIETAWNELRGEIGALYAELAHREVELQETRRERDDARSRLRLNEMTSGARSEGRYPRWGDNRKSGVRPEKQQPRKNSGEKKKRTPHATESRNHASEPARSLSIA